MILSTTITIILYIIIGSVIHCNDDIVMYCCQCVSEISLAECNVNFDNQTDI